MFGFDGGVIGFETIWGVDDLDGIGLLILGFGDCFAPGFFVKEIGLNGGTEFLESLSRDFGLAGGAGLLISSLVVFELITGETVVKSF